MHHRLSLTRLNLLRAGYLLMGAGLAIVEWPLLTQAHTMPLYEGVTLCLLTALSLLALLGVFRPIRLLPVLLFEVTWKVLWMGFVALPQQLSGGLDDASRDVLASCALVVLIVAVVPWRFVWRTVCSSPIQARDPPHSEHVMTSADRDCVTDGQDHLRDGAGRLNTGVFIVDHALVG